MKNLIVFALVFLASYVLWNYGCEHYATVARIDGVIHQFFVGILNALAGNNGQA